jgi:alkylation response protein AidB-like acyl-CoA dehydrogenase
MLVALEQARSMAMYAAMSVELDDEAERARRMAMAKCAVDQWGRFVAQTALQLHGGIALADEYAIGHYFRRLMAIEHSFGDSRYHLAALAAAS